MGNSLKTRLRRAGHRITKPRQAVLKILQYAKHPLAAAEILEKLEKGNTPIDLATVYRNLTLLSKLGLASQVEFSQEGLSRYSWRAGGAIQHHIKCQSCGRIASFVQSSLADIRSRIERKTQFRITEQSFELNGICPKCQ